MGLYFVGPGDYGPFVRAVERAQPPMVVLANELEKLSREVRRVSPLTFIVGRVTGFDSFPGEGYDAGVAQVRHLAGVFAGLPLDAISIANEQLPKSDPSAMRRVCNAYIGAMEEARKLGLPEVVAGDINTGFPDLSVPGMLDAMGDMLRSARYFAAHFYSHGANAGADSDALLWSRIVAGFSQLIVLITEFGALAESGPIPRGDEFVSWIRGYDALLMPFGDRCKGAAVYAVVPQPEHMWKRWDVTPELDRYASYVVSRR